MRYFPRKTLSFWTSLIAVTGIFLPNRYARAVAGYAGLICGLGGAGVVYERISVREGIALEPVLVVKNANKEDFASLGLHLLFGAIGLAAALRGLTKTL